MKYRVFWRFPTPLSNNFKLFFSVVMYFWLNYVAWDTSVGWFFCSTSQIRCKYSVGPRCPPKRIVNNLWNAKMVSINKGGLILQLTWLEIKYFGPFKKQCYHCRLGFLVFPCKSHFREWKWGTNFNTNLPNI